MINTEDLDFSGVENKREEAAKVLQKQRENPSSSTKKLDLTINPDDSAITRTVKKMLNDSDMTYGDVINYYNNAPIPVKPEKDAKRKKGKEPSESAIAFARARKGGNVIIGLRKRSSMYDTTVQSLVEMVGRKIAFVSVDDPDDIIWVE